jgi:hypothetical protein
MTKQSPAEQARGKPHEIPSSNRTPVGRSILLAMTLLLTLIWDFIFIHPK